MTMAGGHLSTRMTAGRIAAKRYHATPRAAYFLPQQAFMNILLIGGGGREHALAWKIAASPLADRVYCAPGNAGIAEEAECVPIEAGDRNGLIAFCRRMAIDFVVVGPEAPLVAG